MSKTEIGSNAQFTSAGKGLNSVGKHSYAYSGKVVVTNSLKELLNYQTESGYTVATISFNYDTTLGGSNNYDFTLLFNNIEIMKIELASPSQSAQAPAIQMRKVIIPPYTNVVVKAINMNADSDHDCYAMITGEVYG
jgi:hypothetical protein